MTTMKVYHDLYLKCDVLLLAGVFKTFRRNSLKNYGFWPSHYLSAPASNWDALLNMTKVELELILDADMDLFIEKLWEVELFKFSQDNNIVKPTISIWNLITLNKNKKILYT